MRVILGYDGSPAAAAAIDVGATLFPGAQGFITYLWGPPFASEQVRRRLWEHARNIDTLTAAVEREGEREAHWVTGLGVSLARAAGWQAEPLLERTFAGEGTGLVRAADKSDADLVIVGSRGLGGSDAILGSVSDIVVHHCSRPVVVVPHPMLSVEYDALAAGPVVVGWDGSTNAEAALAAASRLLPHRHFVAVSVDDDSDPPAPESVGDARVTRVHVNRGRGRHAHAVAQALIAAADEHGAALVVVGSRGRSVAREIILGSVAMGTLHHCHRPVMVVPG